MVPSGLLTVRPLLPPTHTHVFIEKFFTEPEIHSKLLKATGVITFTKGFAIKVELTRICVVLYDV